MKKLVVAIVSCLVLAGGVLSARPVRNVSAARHPNLAAAQRLCQQAFDKVEAAQEANEWDMRGHARKAKELLEEVNRELKEAALAANTR
jgi:hypothetical protein